MDDLNEDDMALIHQLYPGVYTRSTPPQEAKPRRRRKKSREPESGGGEGRGKRKLSAEQVELLERNFGDEHKLESERKDRLAAELGLDPRQVAVWFQNRRARWKSKKLEVEYAKLKSLHENAVVEKCRLQSEVLKLEEQLSKAKMEIERLSARADRGLSGNSPCSSITADATDNPIWGDFGVAEECDDQDVLYYVPHSAYQMGTEWFDLFM